MSEPGVFSDEAKLKLISELIAGMSSEFKAIVTRQLLADPDDPLEARPATLQMVITSNEEIVRIDFGKAVAWIGIPKPEAIKIALLILEHCGASIKPAADITPAVTGGNPDVV